MGAQEANHQVKRAGVGVLAARFCSEPRVPPPHSKLPHSQVPIQDGEDRMEGPLGGGSVDGFLQALRGGVVSPRR